MSKISFSAKDLAVIIKVLMVIIEFLKEQKDGADSSK